MLPDPGLALLASSEQITLLKYRTPYFQALVATIVFCLLVFRGSFYITMVLDEYKLVHGELALSVNDIERW